MPADASERSTPGLPQPVRRNHAGARRRCPDSRSASCQAWKRWREPIRPDLWGTSGPGLSRHRTRRSRPPCRSRTLGCRRTSAQGWDSSAAATESSAKPPAVSACPDGIVAASQWRIPRVLAEVAPSLRGPTQSEGGYFPACQSRLETFTNEAQSSGGLPRVSILAKTVYGSVLLPDERSVRRSLTHA